MKKISLVLICLLISTHGFASEDSIMLWAGFDTSMSAQDVFTKTQGLRDTSGPGKEKIGLEITYGKKDEKVTSLGYLAAYCSMTADRRLRIKGELATIKWCFDSVVTKDHIPPDNKLVFIQIRVDGPTNPSPASNLLPNGLTFDEFYAKFYIAAAKKYEETSLSEQLWPDGEAIRAQPTVKPVPDIATSQSCLFENENVLIFLRSSVFSVSPFGFVHLEYAPKQAYLEAYRQGNEVLEAKAIPLIYQKMNCSNSQGKRTFIVR